MVEEVWKQIKDFPNYEVSDQGRVRNAETHYIIKPQLGSSGYLTVRIRKRRGDYDKSALNIHRLVAEAFVEGWAPGLHVNHKDGNKLNNCASNLEWCTRKENSQHAMRLGLFNPQAPEPPKRKVRIVETGEVFNSIRDCAKAVGVAEQHIWACLNGRRNTRNRLHFEYVSDPIPPTNRKPFLYPHQKEAVEKAFDGAIINGGVGSGKSRTGLYYFFKEYGGQKEYGDDYTPMTNPPDLYIITTAKKRNDLEWDSEMAPFLMTQYPETAYYDHKVTVDSWQNIQKYTDVRDSFFVFDEDHVTGYGAWTKAFLKITRSNRWIILSASPGDKWEDFIPVFIANGFYKNKTEFAREHLVYSQYSKYPKVERYINEQRLLRLKRKILIDMDFSRHTIPHHEDVYVGYDIVTYKDTIRKRWDPYKDEPIQQASGLCYVLRRIVNSDESRQAKLLEILEDHPRAIIFYNYDYERDILLNLGYAEGTEVAEYNGHAHQPIPDSEKWVFLCQYVAGCEGFNCIKTDTTIFFSQSYSYKTMIQAAGRIDRLNSPYVDLYYYHLKSRSGIDLAISKALKDKKQFNERRWLDSWK